MENKPSALTRFFWFCAGVNTTVLALCPQSEHNRFVGIGATVFFTGVLAAFSGGYALYTAFDSYLLAIFMGVFWGLIIFNLDRFMVSSIKKEGSFSKQFWQAFPRFLLALVLAVVISKPLELRIFEPEIIEILEDRRTDKLAAVEQYYSLKKEDKSRTITLLQERLDDQLATREQYYQDYRCECDGTCGTGKTGRGSECERKEKKYLQINEEYLALKGTIEQEIAEVRNEIQQIQQQENQAYTKTDEVYAHGLVARLSAAGGLPMGPSIMIPLLILLIEISPILAKLLAPRGPYDEGLKRVEEAYLVGQEEVLKEQRILAENKNALLENLTKAEMEQQVRQRQKALQVLSQAQLELVKEQVEQWLNEEKGKLKK